MVTRTDVSEALDRVVEVMTAASEEELAAVLAVVGASRRRPAAPAVSRTPLPEADGQPHIVSEVEWV
ncbi:hypothetical protein GCM10010503_12000 [Streptomyces lucensis JCM 4490]|uniref:Uncharacterized protein n=1 Tax=Streptomyces lucensis JCM 4490 TaxID=1306176 RepID=A0A918MMX1_9ACTN|nr:hypothetical protein GCM10010503_12000 [Streptomyces lucensis JCM 4490]